MATEVELERTFLVSSLPVQINGAPHDRIDDGFLTTYNGQPVLRLRHRNDVFEITKKVPVNEGDASQHDEHTITLNQQEYEKLLASFPYHIRKTRYFITVYGQQAELDVFGGDLSGLVTVDFEFKDEAVMKAFKPPEFCLVEVTQEEIGAAGKMAGLTYANIQSDLEQRGYQPIFYEEGQQVV